MTRSLHRELANSPCLGLGVLGMRLAAIPARTSVSRCLVAPDRPCDRKSRARLGARRLRQWCSSAVHSVAWLFISAVLVVVAYDLAALSQRLDVLGSNFLGRAAVQMVGQHLVVCDGFELSDVDVAADGANLSVCVLDFHCFGLSLFRSFLVCIIIP